MNKTVLTEDETKIEDGFEQAIKLFTWSKEAWVQIEKYLNRMDPQLSKMRANALIYRLADLVTVLEAIQKFIDRNKVDWQPKTDN